MTESGNKSGEMMTIMCEVCGGNEAINFDTLLLSANEKFVLKLVIALEVELSCRHFGPISQ